MRDLFSEFFRGLFNTDPEGLQYEEFRIEKNGVKTTIRAGFDKQGFLMDLQSTCMRENTVVYPTQQKAQLQKDLDKAVEEEDYSKAAELQKQLKALDQPTS